MTRRWLAGGLYVAAVVGANWLTRRYGLVPVGFGLMVTAGTFAAGVALLARNLGQDALGRRWIIALMALGVVLSWWLASPVLASASAAAFTLSETVDMSVYNTLRRVGRPAALAAAGAIGAVVDTLAFLHLAGFPLTWAVLAGQLLVKAGISAAVALALGVRRALHGEPVHTEGA